MKRLIALMLVLAATTAHAEGGMKTTGDSAKWKAECGSCHIAYPPKLLTADNWQQMMGGLHKHFGANAELDAKDNKDILDFLQRNAGSGARHSASSLRISDTTWFKREHREISASGWKNPAVKSASNCTACHVKGDRGDWSERSIRMPAGLRHEEDEEHEHD